MSLYEEYLWHFDEIIQDLMARYRYNQIQSYFLVRVGTEFTWFQYMKIMKMIKEYYFND